MLLSDVIGTLGVFLILLAYFLSIYKKIQTTSKVYLFLNLVGATFACISSVLLGSVPFTILEGTWALVSLIALFKNNGRK
jgi:hypothetical protein